ncbi:MAG: Obg family GTPase CgtA, partial [bacterium]
DKNLATLLDFYYRPELKAGRGEQGRGKLHSGAAGRDLVVHVPIGTIVHDANTGAVVGDMCADGQRFLAAKGGRGGRGNAHFKRSTRRAPRIAEKGGAGEESALQLELKLIADVGLVGYPNAGKSTLLSKISAARPKIAPYPFTTREPHLGLVRFGEDSSCVVADIPGLMEGAHRNVGLGHEFLRHIERTRLLLIVIDMAAVDGHEPLDALKTLETELELHQPELAKKPRLIAANKMDIPDAAARLSGFRRRAKGCRGLIYPISAVTGKGVKELIVALAKMLYAEEAR